MKTFLINALDWLIGKLWNPLGALCRGCYYLNRYRKTQKAIRRWRRWIDLRDPAYKQRREWRLGPFRIIWWGMWRRLPLRDIRITKWFIMSGPYELRWDLWDKRD